MKKRPPATPATEADYLAGRAALVALMLPDEGQAAAANYADPDTQKKTAWKTATAPEKTSQKQREAEAAALRAASKTG